LAVDVKPVAFPKEIFDLSVGGEQERTEQETGTQQGGE